MLQHVYVMKNSDKVNEDGFSICYIIKDGHNHLAAIREVIRHYKVLNRDVSSFNYVPKMNRIYVKGNSTE